MSSPFARRCGRIRTMSNICTKYGCDFQVDLDGQVTCSSCGSRNDDMPVNIKDDVTDK